MVLILSSSSLRLAKNFLQSKKTTFFCVTFAGKSLLQPRLYHLYSLSSSSLCLFSMSICSLLLRNSSSGGSAWLVKIWNRVQFNFFVFARASTKSGVIYCLQALEVL